MVAERAGARTDEEEGRGERRSAEADARRTVGIMGRVGLAGRTFFYAVLVAVAVRIALLGGRSSRQADAHGALTLVSRPLVGKVAIAVVAAGFVLFGAGRLAGALRDSSVSTGRRLTTALQGCMYFAMAYVPVSFLAGNHQSGSEQQQHRTTAKLLGMTGGREIVIGVGVVILVVSVYQVRTAISRDFADGLRTEGASPVVRRLVRVAGTVGIAARAAVYVPIGVFFILAGVQFDPQHAKGIDGELLTLVGRTWGVGVLALVALGLATFTVYSGLEARYREVVSGR